MKYRVFICENVCERRFEELYNLKNYLIINDYTIVDSIDKADIILFFSCGMKKDDSIDKIYQFKMCGKRTIIYGCSVKLLNVEDVDNLLAIELYNYSKLDSVFCNNIQFKNTDYRKQGDNGSVEKEFYFGDIIKTWDPRLLLPKCKDVYSIEISKGCSEKCSYCSICRSTGKLRSRDRKEIVTEMKLALSNNYTKFRLQCENSGSYGTDKDENLGLLIRDILQLENNFSVDLPDLHPKGFVNCFEEIVDLIKSKDVYLIHLPIQSASQTILDSMNRKYDISKVDEKLKKLFELFPDIRIGTDVIIGYPGETQEDFDKTVEFLKKYDFSIVYVHGYCDQPGTYSETLTNKVCENVKCERIDYIYKNIKNVVCYLNDYTLE